MDKDLQTAGSRNLLSKSIYKELGYKESLEDVWLQSEVLDLLCEADSNLQSGGFRLFLWDGWRSDSLQAELWNEYYNQIAVDTGLKGKELFQKTREFVSPPGVSKGIPAPHSTGATIDLTLADTDGNIIDLGGEFDELSERTHPDYYEQTYLQEAEREYRDLRRTLHQALVGVGFVRLPTEWWHFEYGTHRWARETGEKILFLKPEGPPKITEK